MPFTKIRERFGKLEQILHKTNTHKAKRLSDYMEGFIDTFEVVTNLMQSPDNIKKILTNILEHPSTSNEIYFQGIRNITQIVDYAPSQVLPVLKSIPDSVISKYHYVQGVFDILEYFKVNIEPKPIKQTDLI